MFFNVYVIIEIPNVVCIATDIGDEDDGDDDDDDDDHEYSNHANRGVWVIWCDDDHVIMSLALTVGIG